MNYMFWIKKYNTIYIFWSYSNQKVIFWFIILLVILLVHTRYCWEVWVRTLLLTFGFYGNLPHYIQFSLHHNDRIYAYNVSFVCFERLRIFLQVHIYHLLTSKTWPACCDFEPMTTRGLEWMCRALIACVPQR